MTTPALIYKAWNDATEELAKAIANASGLKRGENGSLFLDHFPPMYDAASLNVSGGTDNAPWLGDNPPSSINMDFIIEGRFRERERAREFATQIMGILPIKAQGNLLAVQPTNVPSVEGKYFKMQDTDKPQLLFAVEIRGRCVFSVG